MKRQTTWIFVLPALLVSAAHAQNINGSIAGRVTDQQGSVPGGSVTVSDPSQQISVSTKTNEQGVFVVPGLRPGTYNLHLEAMGFKRLDRPGMRERAARIDGLLEILSSATDGTEVRLSIPGAIAFQTSAVDQGV
jgi:hypothetical protein